MARATINKPTFIDPSRLYAKRGYIEVSGISATRIRDAKRLFGLELPTIVVGKRVFVEGQAGIDYIKQLAALQSHVATESQV